MAGERRARQSGRAGDTGEVEIRRRLVDHRRGQGRRVAARPERQREIGDEREKQRDRQEIGQAAHLYLRYLRLRTISAGSPSPTLPLKGGGGKATRTPPPLRGRAG